MELNTTCRLCLGDIDCDAVPIFTDSPLSYAEQVNEMFRTKLEPLPRWPNNACRGCVKKLEDIRAFKENILSTQSTLGEIVQLCIKTESEEHGEPALVMPETISCDQLIKAEETELTTMQKECSDAEADVVVEDNDSSQDEESDALTTSDSDEDESANCKNSVKTWQRRDPHFISEEEKQPLEDQFKAMGLLKCKICQVETTVIRELLKHVQEEHSDIKYPVCCDLKMVTVPQVHSHMQYHQNPDIFKCQQCSKRFPHKESFSLHLLRHSKPPRQPKNLKKSKKAKDKYLLKLYKKRLNEKPRLDENRLIQEMRSRNLLRCQVCGEEQETPTHLFIHTLEKHKTSGYIMCCQSRLSTPKLAFDHMRYHLDPDVFKCDQCEKKFKTMAYRNLHRRMIHKQNKRFVCAQCGKTFFHSYSHTLHVNRHLPMKDRRFPCNQCESGFETSHKLAHHVASKHTMVRDFLCDICGQGFASKWSLKVHKDTHDKQNRGSVKCPDCGMQFTTRRSLSLHSRVHKSAK